jgi:hypothetical protein
VNKQKAAVVSPPHSNASRPCTTSNVNTNLLSLQRLIQSRICWLFCGLLLSACGPSEQQKAAAAEQKRIECLENICDGDVYPQRDHTKDELLKFNGQWYLGPKYYYSSGIKGASFSWPSKKSRGDIPQVERDSNSDIVFFLSGRSRWPDEVKNIPEPWLGKGEGRFEELQKEGFRMERQQLRPELERVRFFDAQGKPYRNEFFIATKEKSPLGTRVPGIGCESPNANEILDAMRGCTGGFYWQPDIYVDFRLHAKHANDWPEIYKEIIRILQLLKKV